MASAPRALLDGSFYHLYNRGNHKDPIFHQGRDYERFLFLFSDAAREYGVNVAAYCLMPNHYHALVRQSDGGSIEKLMRSFTVSYAKYFNRAYGQVGHLFQGRYKVRMLTSDTDLVGVSRYIHRNPVAITGIGEYEWSSYKEYLGGAPRFCEPELVLEVSRRMGIHSYAIFCESVETSKVPVG